MLIWKKPNRRKIKKKISIEYYSKKIIDSQGARKVVYKLKRWIP